MVEHAFGPANSVPDHPSPLRGRIKKPTRPGESPTPKPAAQEGGMVEHAFGPANSVPDHPSPLRGTVKTP